MIRVEGRAKVTGAARYAADAAARGHAHGALVPATIARGRVVSIDDDAALALPGVLAVLHHGNAPRLAEVAGRLGPDASTRVLQSDRVPHTGWPVALVVAETAEQARAAADALVVTYAREQHDVAFTADHPGHYTPERVFPYEPAVTVVGDVDAELAAAPVVVDETYTTPAEHHAPMEPHAATAHWRDGRLDVVDSNQGAFVIAGDLAGLFALDPAAVRVRAEHVGGGFGGKAVTGAHVLLAVLATLRLGRPVRVVLDRAQVFALTGYRPATVQRLRLGADPDGRLRAVDHDSATATSTLHEYVEGTGAGTRVLYAADALRISHRVTRLDVPTPRMMRAPGKAPGSFALESAMDELAHRCGVDPVALRLRNEPAAGPVTGWPFSSRNLAACFTEGTRRFGWDGRDPRPGVRRDGRWLVGTGTAAAVFPALSVPATAAATAEADGTVTIRVGATDLGTGARTALTLLAAEALGLPVDRVRVLIGDSDFGRAPLAGGSWGTSSWGAAVVKAATRLRETLAEPIPAGGITVVGDTAADLGAPAERHRLAFGAQFAEAAVDVATGEVRVRRLLGVFAVGRVVNPTAARGQLVGGMTMGLSQALHEEALWDRTLGTQVNADLAGYHIATNADVPVIEADWVDDPDPEMPGGIKGLGEIGIVGTAAAIANAVWHATGVRHRHLPIRPDRVLLAKPNELV
ncbi:xanthine dehydrogenase family protein molybdopterin-binding subunit [Actinokineospora iranica]|uniref:Xanthine dehydrogenase, molybdenum binding subunit apoprotein n=1 Tax=Actinokineospora iranica TaxID=1271860 RepID=A0A1G6UA66_9PSEU|nr:xanthine dehydrogenase family protein molybdopterin-binding subunit [Actinokineospora iranica]SDD37445.1 xanthine dehydrogenase, molybdenum binding subunit apoprotein [Actinokineospora iranica]